MKNNMASAAQLAARAKFSAMVKAKAGNKTTAPSKTASVPLMKSKSMGTVKKAAGVAKPC